MLNLEITNCKTNQTYDVLFYGDDAQIENNAVQFYLSHCYTHIMETDSNLSQFPRLFDLMHPTCEHGLSANLCYGPSHYCSDEEIAAGW
jgi:hypothetical protein